LKSATAKRGTASFPTNHLVDPALICWRREDDGAAGIETLLQAEEGKERGSVFSRTRIERGAGNPFF